jgi:peptidoglycan/LPS O-acetylase OafA/YrhL
VLAFALAVSGWFLVQGFPAGEEDFLRGWTWALVVLAVFAGGWVRLPILLRRWLDYLGELSYPLYLLHAPLGLALYFFAGIRGVGAMVILVLAGVALLNHLVDHGLKKVFWIPLVRKAVAWTQGRT